MQLFNLVDNEFEFLKRELELNAPLMREFGVANGPCVHCESVCASGCGANCSDTCGGQGKP